MSKPQIDMINADVYCQLTTQDVADRLNRKKCPLNQAAAVVVRRDKHCARSSEHVDLAKVPEHLF